MLKNNGFLLPVKKLNSTNSAISIHHFNVKTNFAYTLQVSKLTVTINNIFDTLVMTDREIHNACSTNIVVLDIKCFTGYCPANLGQETTTTKLCNINRPLSFHTFVHFQILTLSFIVRGVLRRI